MAEGSNGNKERDTDLVLHEETCCLRSRVFHQTPGRGDGAHERQVAGSHLSDLSMGRERAQAIEPEGDIAVQGDAGVVERFAAVEFPEALDVRIGRDDTVRSGRRP